MPDRTLVQYLGTEFVQDVIAIALAIVIATSVILDEGLFEPAIILIAGLISLLGATCARGFRLLLERWAGNQSGGATQRQAAIEDSGGRGE